LTMARGLALTVSEGRPITGFDDSFRFIGTGSLGPVPVPIVIFAVVFVIAWIVLRRTRHGETIYAVGSNPVAARLSGLPVGRSALSLYVASCLLGALAGPILSARLNSAQPTAGQGYEFEAIAAVGVGGTRCAGGEGGLGGTLLGVLIIEVLDNGRTLLN